MISSAISLSARSWRPPAIKAAADSLRRFASVINADTISSSVKRAFFSIALLLTTEIRPRNTVRRPESLAFIAVLISPVICSLSAIALGDTHLLLMGEFFFQVRAVQSRKLGL